MAVLHKKEEKIQAVLGRLPKKYTHEQFVEMFIKIYSKDWGKIKSAYIKQSQDKEPGTVINMPKPEVYLKQILTIYLQQADEPKKDATSEIDHKQESTDIKKPKVTTPKADKTEKNTPIKTPTKRKVISESTVDEVKKPKAATKKKVEATKK